MYISTDRITLLLFKNCILHFTHRVIGDFWFFSNTQIAQSHL